MAGTPPYVELHAHSAFSFLDGASQPDELALAAAELGYGAMALVDHDNVCGAMEWAQAARALGLRGIVGAEVTVVDDLQRLAHVTLVVRTEEGWRNLCRLLTRAHRPRDVHGASLDADALVAAWMADADQQAARRARVPGRPVAEPPLQQGARERPDPLVTLDDLAEHAGGLTCLAGCATRGLLQADLAAQRPSRAAALLERLQEAFGRAHTYVELQLPRQRGDAARLRALHDVAAACGAPVVATGNVHAHSRMRGRLHEALVAIRLNTTLEGCEAERDGNLARVLRTPAQMAERFCEHPAAVRATLDIAESVEFDLATGLGYRYPEVLDGSGRGADVVLAELCTAELERRYVGRRTLVKARSRLSDELAIIRRHGLSGFFLLHHDVLELAREVAADVRGRGGARSLAPPGRGRGSSVESIVCYLAGLSHVDPLESGLRMGRFLNEDMPSVPDIDLDFPRDIRHGLLRRVVERYGPERCAMVAAHATYRAPGAIRDLGRALALPQAELARIRSSTDARDARWVVEALDDERHSGPRWQAFRELLPEIADVPRQMGLHSGGIVVATDPLDELVPVQPAATRGRLVCQWDKDSCSDAGFLKIDVLGLGMLSAVEECVETIHASGHGPAGEPLDLSRIDYDDRAVFAEIREGDTVGTFQIESRAQIQSIRRVQPENMHDLAVQVALIRPGPIIGQSVNPYVKLREARRRGERAEPEYDHPLLEPVLADTAGAIIFQDQVIEVAMAIAGFSAGEADGLRRAMSRKRAAGSVEAWRERFVAGAVERGVGEEVANRVFDKVTGFCHYGFPRAHAVAFALLAYQSAWLRHHFPAHFVAALANAQPMGFYSPDSLLRDAGRHGVRALGVDVNASQATWTVEELEPADAAAASFGRRPSGRRALPAVRVGLGSVAGVGWDDAVALVAERDERGAYAGIDDLVRRAPLRRDQLERLVMGGACDAMGERRELLWQAGLVARGHGGQEVIEEAAAEAPAFSQLSMFDQVRLDYQATGLSLRAHPAELVRPLVAGGACSTVAEVLREPAGRTVEVVAAVVARQKPPTAKGVVFLLLEDETGQLNAIVAPELYRRQRVVIRGQSLLRVRGRIERQGDARNLIAREVHPLPAELARKGPGRIRSKSWG